MNDGQGTNMIRSNVRQTAIRVAVATAVGYTAAVVWGHWTYDGDLPYAAMIVGMAVVTFPANACVGYFMGRHRSGWIGWPGVALIALVSAIGAMSGIVISSN